MRVKSLEVILIINALFSCLDLSISGVFLVGAALMQIDRALLRLHVHAAGQLLNLAAILKSPVPFLLDSYHEPLGVSDTAMRSPGRRRPDL